MADKKMGDITVYEGDDGKAVWEFEGKVKSDIPLDTKAQDFAGAINELKKLSLEGGGDAWQPPAEWIPVPEPREYDIYVLVNTQQPQAGIAMILADTNNGGGYGTIFCDWGDGTTEEITGFAYISHLYDGIGQFLIHIVCDDNTNFISVLSASPYGAFYLIVKTGSNIFWAVKTMVTYTDTSMLNSLKSLTILNENSISDINNQGLDSVISFRNMRSLQKLQCPKIYVSNLNASNGFLGGPSTKNMKNILQCLDLSKCTSVKKTSINDRGRGLLYNYSLTELTLPNCTYIDDYMFENCEGLRKIIAPKCTYVGVQAFRNCYSLELAEFASNCTFGTNAFQNCYSVYIKTTGQ